MASQARDDPRLGSEPVVDPPRRWWLLGLDARLAGRTAGFVASKLTATIVGAVAALLLSRELSVTAFGNYSFATSFLDYAGLFFEFGLFLPAARAAANAPVTRQRQVTGASLAAFVPVALAFTAFLASITFVMDDVFDVAVSGPVRVVLPVAFAYPLTFALQQVCQGRDAMNAFSTAFAGGRLLFLASIIGLVVVGGEALSLTTALVLSTATMALGWVLLVAWLRPTFQRLRPSVGELTAGARTYGIQAYVGRILSVGTYNVDVLMIAAFASTGDVALYAVAGGLTAPLSLPAYGLTAALFPSMARDDRIQAWVVVFSATTTTALLVGLLLIAHPLIDTLLPDQYLNAIGLLVPLGLAQVVRGTTTVYNTHLAAHGRGSELQFAAVGLTISNVALNLSLIPAFGASGAAWASLGGLTINLIVHVLQYRHSNRIAGKLLPPAPGDRSAAGFELERATQLVDWVYCNVSPDRSHASTRPYEIVRKGHARSGGYSILLRHLLRREGMTTREVTLLLRNFPTPGVTDTHTLVELFTAGQWHALDPTCNVVFPGLSIDDLIENPSLADAAVDNRPHDERSRTRGYDRLYSSFAYSRCVARYDIQGSPRARLKRFVQRFRDRPTKRYGKRDLTSPKKHRPEGPRKADESGSQATGRPSEDIKQASQRVWGAAPAGHTHAPDLKPGERQFFETALRRRSVEELPFLWHVFPSAETTGQRVLEIGCGVGFDAAEFLGHGANYIGIDITPENPIRTRRHLRAATGRMPITIQADAEDVPLRNESIDVVYSFGVLHHTPDLDRALLETHRVLRPGGQCWIAVYHRRSAFFWLRIALLNHLIKRRFRVQTLTDTLSEIEQTPASERPLVRVYTRREVRSALRAAGFVDIDVRVRKLNPEDLPDLPKLGDRLWRRMQPLLNRLGHAFGWYVIALARKSNR